MEKQLFTLIFVCLGLYQSRAQEVQIQYMANQGVWIKSQDKQILIDAVFDKEFEFLDVLPKTELELLDDAKPNYNEIDLILATHLHGDHFHPILTGNHLRANPKTEFFGPLETFSVFQQKFEGFQEISNRVHTDSLQLHQTSAYSLNEIKVEALRLAHFGTHPWNKAENYAYLIHLNGKKILHVGDSNLNVENISKLNLAERKIDVAILPYWQIGSSERMDLIETYIGAKQLLIAHIPLENFADAQQDITQLGYQNAKALTQQFEIIILD